MEKQNKKSLRKLKKNKLIILINDSLQNEIFRAQSFTSLKADLHQDINGGFAFSTLAGALMEHFLEGIALLRQLAH